MAVAADNADPSYWWQQLLVNRHHSKAAISQLKLSDRSALQA
jgi:hypothetical protein